MSLWVLLTFPKGQEPDPMKDSFAGRIGTFIEPAIKPLGFDWKIGVGLLSSQAAREMIIGALSTIYRIEDGAKSTGKLQDALKQNLTPLQAVSLLVFFILAMQCFSTLAIARRELGSWKIPVAMFIYMNALAYAGSLIIFQGGKLLGF
jgi:ferrous iron transport protein B